MIAKRNETMKPYFAEIAQSNFSVQQILTMASLVEKEALTEADRKKVASVFYNRLKKDMPLQTDISVLYAKKEQKEVVTHNDLEYDSLYNLYKYKGLGPGPFNNPSEGSVVAAIEPDDTNYLYFYADINTGKVFFTDDFEQHIAWQKEFEETGTVKE